LLLVRGSHLYQQSSLKFQFSVLLLSILLLLIHVFGVFLTFCGVSLLFLLQP
jgi:hypothetical protein